MYHFSLPFLHSKPSPMSYIPCILFALFQIHGLYFCSHFEEHISVTYTTIMYLFFNLRQGLTSSPGWIWIFKLPTSCSSTCLSTRTPSVWSLPRIGPVLQLEIGNVFTILHSIMAWIASFSFDVLMEATVLLYFF